MVVLRGGAVSHERGTSVACLSGKRPWLSAKVFLYSFNVECTWGYSQTLKWRVERDESCQVRNPGVG